MRKTLQDVARYLKETMVPETSDQYPVHSVYTNSFAEVDIWEGTIAFRAFLARLYDVLAVEGNTYDTSQKVIHAYENRIGLSVYYPFLHNVSALLKNIGYFGVFEKNKKTLVCSNIIFNTKLSTSKTIACLNFIKNCGICIEGMDLNQKKQNLSDIKTLKIQYPDNSVMLVGLKVMAIAEIDYGTLLNQDIFLRCDYRSLKKEKANLISIVQDTIQPLPTNIQDFILHLHNRYIDKGIVCIVEIKGFHIYIKYCYKRKDFFGINVSLNNGYHINVKPVKTSAYMDTIKTLSPVLQQLIAKGYGCGRKREIAHCDGGCRGLPIALDSSVLDIQQDIFVWIDQELSYLKRK